MWARARAPASQLLSFFSLGFLPWWLSWFQQCPFFFSSKATASLSSKGRPSKLLIIRVSYSGLLRMVVRIMVMVPLYAISSLVSLFSLEAAFVIDAIRDIYEVSIYSFSIRLFQHFMEAGTCFQAHTSSLNCVVGLASSLAVLPYATDRSRILGFRDLLFF